MTDCPPHCLGKNLDQIFELEHFLHLGLQGLGWATNATKIFDILKSERAKGTPISEEEYAERKKWLGKVEAFGREQEAMGFPYLYGLATIRLWGIIESMVDDLATYYLTEPSRYLSSSVIGNLKVPLVEFLDCSPEQRAERLLLELKYSVKSAPKEGTSRFEAILNPLGLGGEVDADVNKTLFEMSQVRNVLVHRGGVTDQRFCAACPWFGVEVGEPLLLGGYHFRIFTLAAQWYCLELDRRSHSLSQDLDCNMETANIQQQLSIVVTNLRASGRRGL